MLIRDDKTQLEISAPEIVPTGQPGSGDIRLAVEVSAPGFRGRNGSAWVAGPAWERFLADLRQLERTRRGEASLTSMSPADLELRVCAVDRAGHILVEGHVGDYLRAATRVREACVPFAISLDPSCLPAALAEFAALPGL